MNQNPTLLPHGKYWTFLYRDSKGIQERAKVCPREGPGELARTERELKKFAVMGELGLMTGQPSLSTTLAMTFSMAADHYMIDAINRRSCPLGDSTRTGYISYLDNHLKPFLGEMSLDKINNAVVREFVNKMVVKKSEVTGEKLSAHTVRECVGLLKRVVASVMNEDGDEIFPKTWKNKFIDLPPVGKPERYAFVGVEIEKLVERARMRESALYDVCRFQYTSRRMLVY